MRASRETPCETIQTSQSACPFQPLRSHARSARVTLAKCADGRRHFTWKTQRSNRAGGMEVPAPNALFGRRLPASRSNTSFAINSADAAIAHKFPDIDMAHGAGERYDERTFDTVPWQQ